MAITLNGSTGATVPSLTNEGAYTGDGISFSDAAPSNSLVVNSSGNVGIGTSSPSYKLDVNGITRFTDDVRMTINKAFYLYNLGDTNAAFIKADNSGNMLFSNGLSGVSERMRINNSGTVNIGTLGNWRGGELLSMVATSKDGIAIQTDSAGLIVRKTAYTNTFLCLWENAAGTQIGSITTAGTNVAYNTTSDYRLKENIQPMQNALGVVAQLNPVTYTWKADGSDGQGFIAHELQAVVPDCVTGEKDAVDSEGNPVYQGIDTSFLVATLTKAIQEQQQLIEALTARITALESK